MNGDGFFMRRARDGMTACCEALFPENEIGAPDWKSTEMVSRMWHYLDELPLEQRRLLLLLFTVIELGCVLLSPGLSRFSRHSPERRATIIRRFRGSRLQLLRILGDSVKATTTVIYLSHASSIAHIGAFKSCERPGDSPHFPFVADALQRLGQR